MAAAGDRGLGILRRQPPDVDSYDGVAVEGLPVEMT
jgi:hypothetical protein